MTQSQARRTALISGAAGSLGSAFARELGRRGYAVALADKDPAGLKQLSGELEAAGISARSFELDVTRPDQWRTTRQQLQKAWSHLDLLINSAGAVSVADIDQLQDDAWHHVLDTNLNGTFYGCREMCEWLKSHPKGAQIINVASFSGAVVLPWVAAYTASKAAVIALTETLFVELLPFHVHATVVCPGFFPSRLLESATFGAAELRSMTEHFTRRAVISPEDVVAAALHAAAKRRLYVFLPRQAAWLWRMKRLWPERLMRKIARQAHQQRAKSRARLEEGGG